MSNEKMREAFEAKWPVPQNCIWTGHGYAVEKYNAWDAARYCDKWIGWQAASAVQDTEIARLTAELARAKEQAFARTDISKRLREYANNNGYSHGDYADTMRAGAEEIERYYGGMKAWKKSAEMQVQAMIEGLQSQTAPKPPGAA